MYPTIVPNNPKAGAICSLLYPAVTKIKVPTMTVSTITGRVMSSDRILLIRRKPRMSVPIIARPRMPIRQVSQNSYGVFEEKNLAKFPPVLGFCSTGAGGTESWALTSSTETQKINKVKTSKRAQLMSLCFDRLQHTNIFLALVRSNFERHAA